VATGSDDIMRVVQTLMAAKVITGDGFSKVPMPGASSTAAPVLQAPSQPPRRG
jgi:hypothetical protein